MQKELKQLLTSLVESNRAIYERIGQMVSQKDFDTTLGTLIAAITALTTAATALLAKVSAGPSAADLTTEAQEVQTALDQVTALSGQIGAALNPPQVTTGGTPPTTPPA